MRVVASGFVLVLVSALACAVGACTGADDDSAMSSGANGAAAMGGAGAAMAMLPGGSSAVAVGGGGGGGASGSAAGSGAAGAVAFDAGTAGAGGSAGSAARDGSTAVPAGGSDSSSGSDAGIDGGSTGNDDDRCNVAGLDPANPPRALEVTGDLGTHDPSVVEEDGVFYLHQTGPRLPGKRSSDMRAWQRADSALGGSNPAWVGQEVPGASDLWAPDLSHWGGQYHLYYSASTFGSNSSCIGHATRASMASGSWSDHGSVVCSNHGSNDNWNAIDPNAVVDQDGKAYLVFGSFWDGIKAIELDGDGARANSELHSIASRGGGAIEAPYVVRRCGWYYLFVSFDKCCDGANSTYNIRVGRSKDVLGPYVDKSGKAMMEGGGTMLVQGGGSWRGPGHSAVLFSGDKAFNVFHAYRSDNGASQLRVSEIAWDADGWPVSGGP